jgi:hypothetical protein
MVGGFIGSDSGEVGFVPNPKGLYVYGKTIIA